MNRHVATAPQSSVRYDLSGRTAIVTGNLKGIGAAIAAALRAANARTLGWDLGPADGRDQFCVDVTDHDKVARAFGTLTSVDIVVNNAGYAGPTLPLEDYPPDEFRRILDVNLMGTLNVCRAALPLLRKSPYGRIVNIASLAGKEGTPNASAYSASKAAVIALTKSLGKELAGTGVLVNAVAPAAVETEILSQMSPEHVQTMIDKSPQKRLIQPREVAELVMWLCSDACTANIGAVFDLSAGRATY